MTCYRVLPYFRSLKSSRVKSAHTAHATSVFDDMRLDYKIRTRTAASENANHDKMNEIKHQLKVKNMFPIKSDSVPNKVEEKNKLQNRKNRNPRAHVKRKINKNLSAIQHASEVDFIVLHSRVRLLLLLLSRLLRFYGF